MYRADSLKSIYNPVLIWLIYDYGKLTLRDWPYTHSYQIIYLFLDKLLNLR